MDKALKQHLEYLLCVRIASVRPVSGGDISQAYLLETETERFFCKINRTDKAYKMFLEEKKGLDAIAKTGTIATPRVLFCEASERGGIILMEYIEPKSPSPSEMGRFGNHLAGLHQRPVGKEYGWETDNFIGSLSQSNNLHTDWSKFYVAERLLPQLRLARDKNRLQKSDLPAENRLLETCQNLFPETRPSLLHGDLWSGNFLVSGEGTPYLIDPATYYGHHEVDIAMTKLFGGFGESFYRAYAEHFPPLEGEIERTEIYQLYYLLVHLNLFGKSYYGSVKHILDRYF